MARQLQEQNSWIMVVRAANLWRRCAKLGIVPGDPIRVTTRRGTVELAARQDDAIPDGVVFIPFAFVEAAANLLTNPALDPFGKIPEFKFCAARVERADAVREAAE
jgi:formate dehydrogenase major subunit